jgi:hypothetical protein
VTYRRVRIYQNCKTKTKIFFQYQAACSWLPAFKLTLIAALGAYLLFSELKNVFRCFEEARLLTVELAIEFFKSSNVDRGFVLRYALFGKSKAVPHRIYGDLRFGTRHSAWMVRAYKKEEMDSFRVELEFHSSWLRKHGITRPNDLRKLATLTQPTQIQFVKLDWNALAIHLNRKGLPANKTIRNVRAHSGSLLRVLHCLRNEIGLHNVRRFLRPLRLNRKVQEALNHWLHLWLHSDLRSIDCSNEASDE